MYTEPMALTGYMNICIICEVFLIGYVTIALKIYGAIPQLVTGARAGSLLLPCHKQA